MAVADPASEFGGAISLTVGSQVS